MYFKYSFLFSISKYHSIRNKIICFSGSMSQQNQKQYVLLCNHIVCVYIVMKTVLRCQMIPVKFRGRYMCDSIFTVPYIVCGIYVKNYYFSNLIFLIAQCHKRVLFFFSSSYRWNSNMRYQQLLNKKYFCKPALRFEPEMITYIHSKAVC